MQNAKQEDGESESDSDTTKQKVLSPKGIKVPCLGSVKQLIMPQCVWEVILTLGRLIPWASHLGKHKTADRIEKHFYWPGLKADVSQYFRICHAESPSIPPNLSALHLKVLEWMLLKEVIDNNRFMLVITDYSTRYREVFPLKSIRAKYVATCLVQLFSKVRFPC